MAEIRGNLELNEKRPFPRPILGGKENEKEDSLLVNPLEKVNEEGNGV